MMFPVWHVLIEILFVCERPEAHRVNDAVRGMAREAAEGGRRDKTAGKKKKGEREEEVQGELIITPLLPLCLYYDFLSNYLIHCHIHLLIVNVFNVFKAMLVIYLYDLFNFFFNHYCSGLIHWLLYNHNNEFDAIIYACADVL